jgi:predicted DNA-binding protein YlxM (UPF0122 family)
MVNVRLQLDLNPEERLEAMEIAKQAIYDQISKCVYRPKSIIVQKEGSDWIVEMEATQKTIVRTRRITGYLSNLNNFNAAKKAEERERKAHVNIWR